MSLVIRENAAVRNYQNAFSLLYFCLQKSAFKDASVCLFIFDCLQFNDENMMKK